MENKKLYRSATNYVFGGVAGGLGDYLQIDATLIRLAFLLFTFAGGAGPIIYIVLMVIIPKETVQGDTRSADVKAMADKSLTVDNSKTEEMTLETKTEKVSDEKIDKAVDFRTEDPRPRNRNLLSLILITVGLVMLGNQLMPTSFINWNNLWPILLIIVGFTLIFRR